MSPIDHLALFASLLLVTAGVLLLITWGAHRLLARRKETPREVASPERRRHPRRPVERVVALLSESSLAGGARVEDISASGLCLHVEAEGLPIGVEYHVSILAPGRSQPLAVRARSVWSHDGRAGLAFMESDSDLRDWLETVEHP